MVSIRLTANQEQKIQETGLNRSEFIRRAVDYYLLYLQDPYRNLILDELEEWIKYKRVTTVTHDNTDVLHNNTDVTYDNTDVLHNSTDVTIGNTSNTPVTQKVHQTGVKQKENTIKNKLQPELSMLKRVLNNPLNSDTVPDGTLKLLSKKYDLSKSAIQGWITENKMAIKEGKL